MPPTRLAMTGTHGPWLPRPQAKLSADGSRNNRCKPAPFRCRRFAGEAHFRPRSPAADSVLASARSGRPISPGGWEVLSPVRKSSPRDPFHWAEIGDVGGMKAWSGGAAFRMIRWAVHEIRIISITHAERAESSFRYWLTDVTASFPQGQLHHGQVVGSAPTTVISVP